MLVDVKIGKDPNGRSKYICPLCKDRMHNFQVTKWLGSSISLGWDNGLRMVDEPVHVGCHKEYEYPIVKE